MALCGFFRLMLQKLSGILYNHTGHRGIACTSMKQSRWDLSTLYQRQARKDIKYAVVVLNRPITHTHEFFQHFWNDATLRMTVDGGTTRWDSYLSTLPIEKQETVKNPDLITGDFDSITPDMLLKYQMKGCKTINTPDQDHTDFTKAIIELCSYCKQNNTELDHVVAIGQSSGRLDHVLGNIQTLFLNRELQILSPNTKLYLLSDDAVSWLLTPGEHIIDVPEETRISKKSWCSLVPVGETCENVTTNGLKWNLDNQPLKFGKVISTSNTFSGCEQVMISCSHTLLWSMRLPGLTH